jgi:hypothetical protein
MLFQLFFSSAIFTGEQPTASIAIAIKNLYFFIDQFKTKLLGAAIPALA